jgi:hypothetical protein
MAVTYPRKYFCIKMYEKMPVGKPINSPEMFSG